MNNLLQEVLQCLPEEKRFFLLQKPTSEQWKIVFEALSLGRMTPEEEAFVGPCPFEEVLPDEPRLLNSLPSLSPAFERWLNRSALVSRKVVTRTLLSQAEWRQTEAK
jgi:hypothetical protein